MAERPLPPQQAEPAAPNKLGIANAKQLARVEEAIVKGESQLLRIEPVHGKLDAEQLKAVHKRLFGQIYEHAGQVREPTSGWGKSRLLSDGSRHFVAYHSLQGIVPEKAVNNIMQRAVEELRAIRPNDTAAIAKSTARMYADLDHLHLFKEGNSRTLRTFVSQVVRETTGRRLEWDATDRNGSARDELYRARDAQVVARQIPREVFERQLKQLSHTVHALRGTRPLDSVMRENLEVGLQRDLATAMGHSAELVRRVVEVARGRYAANFEHGRAPIAPAVPGQLRSRGDAVDQGRGAER